MREILLINPNSSSPTTDMMVDIASRYANGYRVKGRTAIRSPLLIVDEEALNASAAEVVDIGCEESAHGGVAGMVVAAFGDPGIEELRGRVAVPVAGLCEASMLAAAAGGRRFAVATTTPRLVPPIEAKARLLGLDGQFAGVRLTRGDPVELTGDPQRIKASLAAAVIECVEEDGAEVVIIGGGPLGQVAAALSEELRLPVIAPIREAMLSLLKRIEG